MFFKMLKFLARECRVGKTLTLANKWTQIALSRLQQAYQKCTSIPQYKYAQRSFHIKTYIK